MPIDAINVLLKLEVASDTCDWFAIFIGFNLLTLLPSHDCPSANQVTLKDMA